MAKEKDEQSPEFFKRSPEQRSPEYLNKRFAPITPIKTTFEKYENGSSISGDGPVSPTTYIVNACYSPRVVFSFNDKVSFNKSSPIYYNMLTDPKEEIVRKLTPCVSTLKNPDSKTIMYYASAEGNLEIVKKSLEFGANPNIGDDEGLTPLHIAILYHQDGKRDNISLIKALIEKGANVNIQDGYGDTPLHSACKWGNGNIAKLLLEYGADPKIKNNEGELPHQLINIFFDIKTEFDMDLLLPKEIETSINSNSNGKEKELSGDESMVPDMAEN